MRAIPWCLLLLCGADPAAAQDFSAARRPGPDPGAMVLLEHALPAAGGTSVESGATQWLSVAGLATRAAALAVPVSAARIGLGVSQTGEPGVGWTSVALAIGAASERGGAALRASVRRDRDPQPLDGGLGPGWGAEAGAGLWLALHPGAQVWASAPQVQRAGLAPPLVRPLACGVRVSWSEVSMWSALSAGRAHAEAGERRLGGALAVGAGTLWLEARDGPWRAGGGVELLAGRWRVAGSVESHPLLGETTRITVGHAGAGVR